MNNAQLDMVLDYLNEGTEIDTICFLNESLIKEINNIQYLEKSEYLAESVIEKIKGAFKKIGELIRRFFNWIGEMFRKIKEIFIKSKNKHTEAKVKATTDNLQKEVKENDKDANYELEEKIMEFNKSIRNMVENFNESNDITSDGKGDMELYFINDGSKFIHKVVGVNENRIKTIVDAIKNKSAGEILFQNYFAYSAERSGLFKRFDDSSTINAFLRFEGDSNMKSIISAYKDEAILAGNSISGEFALSLDNVKKFGETILSYSKKSNKSFENVIKAIDRCKALYKECDNLYKEIDKAFEEYDAQDKKKEDSKLYVTEYLTLISKSISNTQKDLNYFTKYFTGQFNLINNIAEQYKKTFG